jgi:hypothetical protein
MGLIGALFALHLLQPVLGLSGSVAIVALVGIAEVASDFYFGNLFRPRSIRAEPEGIEVRPMFGAIRRFPWSETRLDGRAGPGGYSILRFGGPPERPTGAMFLTTDQSVALRSSPFRPPSWSPAGSAGATSTTG